MLLQRVVSSMISTRKSKSAPMKSPWEQGPLTMRNLCTCDDELDQKLIEVISACSRKFISGEADAHPCDNLENSENFEAFKAINRLHCSIDVEALQLKSENIARVVPEKIMSLRIFPTLDMQMIAVGNKFGDIGFWNVNGKQEDGDGIFLYHPHTAPVSGFVINPFSISKMYSSCYDGSIRLMDVEKEVFYMVYSSEYSIYSISQSTHDVKSLYFGEGIGGINMWDVRAGKSSFLCDLHEYRINTIDFNSDNEYIMATSSTDGTACIWDLRQINADKPAPLKTVTHKRAVASAYFSPSGKCLATTSADDKVSISSGANYEDTCMVYHNNQTGRCFSPFRGIWGWDDSSIFISNTNMKRGVDVISVEAERIVATLEKILNKSKILYYYMYSSCYDGSIRLMDVEKEVFDMVYSSEYSIYSISQSTHDVKSLYFGEGIGGINMWDVRAGKSSFSCDLHEYRINTIDFNSDNEYIMATSSTDGTACIWDLRQINADKPAPLKTVTHKRAVASAYFSPSGKCLATTSADDKVSISSGANYEDTSMVYHNNQTGALISPFRGIWGWDDSSIFIGNMKRRVDVISVEAERRVATLESDLLSAIPCLLDAHPYNAGMLAGTTGGGQVFVWALP
ncbi:hypothetical protein ACS0TY_021637 [Phlomoides rotata]